MKIISIDPGEHIGIILAEEANIRGLTIEGECRNAYLWNYLNTNAPDVVIYEQFALRAKSATKLVGDKFITCEVIGVVKLYCQVKGIEPIVLQPFNKEYCGFSSNPKDPHYSIINCGLQKITEHVRDAYRLYSYATLFRHEM